MKNHWRKFADWHFIKEWHTTNMNKQELEKLKELLEQFVSQDYFGMGEMNEIKQVEAVIELVDGAIINL